MVLIEKTNELKVQLTEVLDAFEKEAIPLLMAIDELELLEYVLLTLTLYYPMNWEEFDHSMTGRFMTGMSKSQAGRKAKARRDLLNNSISISKCRIPMQEKNWKG